MKHPIFLVILGILSLCSACALGSTAPVTVVFPGLPGEVPASWLEGEWTLAYRDGSGSGGRKRLNFRPGRRCRVEAAKETVLICALYPPAQDGNFRLRPAGGVFVSGGRRELALDWASGAGAEFLLEASRAGLDPARLNLARLTALIREKGDPDPWGLDWEVLARQLSKREMRVWYVREKTRFSLELALPPGRWIGESCWLPPLEGGGELTLSLWKGPHLFRRLADGAELLLGVDGEGEWFASFEEG